MFTKDRIVSILDTINKDFGNLEPSSINNEISGQIAREIYNITNGSILLGSEREKKEILGKIDYLMVEVFGKKNLDYARKYAIPSKHIQLILESLRRLEERINNTKPEKLKRGTKDEKAKPNISLLNKETIENVNERNVFGAVDNIKAYLEEIQKTIRREGQSWHYGIHKDHTEYLKEKIGKVLNVLMKIATDRRKDYTQRLLAAEAMGELYNSVYNIHYALSNAINEGGITEEAADVLKNLEDIKVIINKYNAKLSTTKSLPRKIGRKERIKESARSMLPMRLRRARDIEKVLELIEVFYNVPRKFNYVLEELIKVLKKGKNISATPWVGLFETNIADMNFVEFLEYVADYVTHNTTTNLGGISDLNRSIGLLSEVEEIIKDMKTELDKHGMLNYSSDESVVLEHRSVRSRILEDIKQRISDAIETLRQEHNRRLERYRPKRSAKIVNDSIGEQSENTTREGKEVGESQATSEFSLEVVLNDLKTMPRSQRPSWLADNMGRVLEIAGKAGEYMKRLTSGGKRDDSLSLTGIEKAYMAKRIGNELIELHGIVRDSLFMLNPYGTEVPEELEGTYNKLLELEQGLARILLDTGLSKQMLGRPEKRGRLGRVASKIPVVRRFARDEGYLEGKRRLLEKWKNDLMGLERILDKYGEKAGENLDNDLVMIADKIHEFEKLLGEAEEFAREEKGGEEGERFSLIINSLDAMETEINNAIDTLVEKTKRNLLEEGISEEEFENVFHSRGRIRRGLKDAARIGGRAAIAAATTAGGLARKFGSLTVGNAFRLGKYGAKRLSSGLADAAATALDYLSSPLSALGGNVGMLFDRLVVLAYIAVSVYILYALKGSFQQYAAGSEIFPFGFNGTFIAIYLIVAIEMIQWDAGHHIRRMKYWVAERASDAGEIMYIPVGSAMMYGKMAVAGMKRKLEGDKVMPEDVDAEVINRRIEDSREKLEEMKRYVREKKERLKNRTGTGKDNASNNRAEEVNGGGQGEGEGEGEQQGNGDEE